IVLGLARRRRDHLEPKRLEDAGGAARVDRRGDEDDAVPAALAEERRDAETLLAGRVHRPEADDLGLEMEGVEVVVGGVDVAGGASAPRTSRGASPFPTSSRPRSRRASDSAERSPSLCTSEART